MKNILIEIQVTNEKEIEGLITELNDSKLVLLDRSYKPVRIKRRQKESQFSENTFVIRGKSDELNFSAIEKFPFVYKIWIDTKIDHFLCSCNASKKGSLDDVATCIGATQLWSKGYRGEGIIMGIVDGGVDKEQIPNVLNGSSPDWGTNIQWEGHGNMTSTDARGIAPGIGIYDLRIADTAMPTISNAIAAYQWALWQYDLDGTPHILSNSWGIYQENWDPGYATNPNHPFTLKVEEVIDKGIKVVFSAGNCGQTCPSFKCGNDTGNAKDIWGANGHKEVMTVGAVKLNNNRLKYSSQGPAALSDQKPDFCSYSSFKGYYWGITREPDGGTSAACPVVAGCVALLLDYNPALTQGQIKSLLQDSAKDIENFGFDYNTGYGVVRLDDAYYRLAPSQKPKEDFRDTLCDYVFTIERKCIQWEETRYRQCTQTSDQGYNHCTQTRDDGYNSCTQTRDNGYNSCANWQKNCCTWAPCSWVCKLFTWICIGWFWVSAIVCIAWTWIANIVCIAWVWVANIVCIAWTWVVSRICKLYLWIITGITLTNCKCR